MSDLDLHIASAYWMAPGSLCVLLNKNWDLETQPTFKLNDPSLTLCRLRSMPSSDLAQFTSYQDKGASIQFQINPKKYPHLNFHSDPVAVVGSFNDWGDNSNLESFELSSTAPHNPEALLKIELKKSELGQLSNPIDFKFKTHSGYWLNPLASAPNLHKDEASNTNYTIDPQTNGAHAFLLNLESERGMDRSLSVTLNDTHFTPIKPGLSFFDLKTPLALGAIIESDRSTSFRLFAPRASRVFVETQLSTDQKPNRHELKLNHDQLTWELNIQQDLSGFYYSFYYIKILRLV